MKALLGQPTLLHFKAIIFKAKYDVKVGLISNIQQYYIVSIEPGVTVAGSFVFLKNSNVLQMEECIIWALAIKTVTYAYSKIWKSIKNGGSA